jgi:hypothetical protein
VMNIVQPRVMASAVGIHPVAVLVSVLIGLKVAGVAGAIFALPFAAVIAAFFHHFLDRSTAGPRDVTSRAARRVEEREGRHVRVPTPPPVTVSPSTAAGAPIATDEMSSQPERPERPERRRMAAPSTDPAPGPVEPGA